MKPIETKETNCTYAEHQPEYLPLPAHRDEKGIVTTCWELSFEELAEICLTKKIYLQTLTFCKPYQPVKMTVENPLRNEND